MDLAQAGYKLGSVFGGRGSLYDNAKSAEELRLIKVAGERAATDRKVDQAIQEQQKRVAIQGVLADPTIPDRDKNFIVGALGSEYAATMQGNLRAQEMGFRGDAVSRALAGDYNGANANLFGVANAPQALTDVDGNQIIRNKFSTEGVVENTDVADSVAAANYARAHASNEQANLASVKAAAGGFAPRAPAGGKAGARTEPPQHLLSAYFGGPTGKIDRAKVMEFNEWRAEHPEVRNGTDALVAFENRPMPWEGGGHGTMTVEPGRKPVVRITSPANPVSAAFSAGDPGQDREAVMDAVPESDGGPGFQVPVPGAPPVTVKVPGVPEAKGPVQATSEWDDVRDTPAGKALQEARDAIARGAPKEAVRDRLKKMNYKNIASRL
jgi:hypothetical protein